MHGETTALESNIPHPLRHAWAAAPDLAPRRRNRSDRALRRAIDKGSMVLHFQPRWTLADGMMVGGEALVRWPDRRRGLVPPDEFIPIAERTGSIHALGRWVLQAACVEAARWSGVPVSVNVSARQIEDGTLLADLADALTASGLAPESLELELPEAALLGCDGDTLLLLSTLRDIGVRLALDNFGLGVASLSMLKRLPLTTLKIDRLLVRELPGRHEDAAMAHAIIGAARALDLVVVAEGIESEEQRALLAGLGCDQGQGFLLSRPVPAEAMRGFFAA